MADASVGQSYGKCRYSNRYGATSHGTGIECRRYPPGLVDDMYNGQAVFPDVRSESWCGEYAPANPETVTDGAATLARLVLLGDLTAARALANKLRE